MHNRYLLTRFVKEAMMSPNPALAQQAGQVDDLLMNMQEDESITDADMLKQEHPEMNVKQQLEDVDQMFHQAMPEIVEPEAHELRGIDGAKQASAYVKDLPLSDVPGLNKADIARFASGAKQVMVVQYGMVVKELLPKVDPHNFELAVAHIKKDWADRKIEALKDEVYEQAKKKYILILNDSIIDGHHFLAKAKLAGLTSSLNVIDLTPVRFQKTASQPASTWDKLIEHYGHSNHGWKNPFEKRGAGRVPRVRGQ